MCPLYLTLITIKNINSSDINNFPDLTSALVSTSHEQIVVLVDGEKLTYICSVEVWSLNAMSRSIVHITHDLLGQPQLTCSGGDGRNAKWVRVHRGWCCKTQLVLFITAHRRNKQPG